MTPANPTMQPSARDWTEDFGHENGNFMNTCHTDAGGCGMSFFGYKRRHRCKLCAAKGYASAIRNWRGTTRDPDDEERLILALDAALTAAEARIAELEKMISAPHNADWFDGVKIEAAHQTERWGASHDAGKAPADWFWLIGYLAQKAMTAHQAGDTGKATHHTISTGAAMLNWYRAITGQSDAMRPGIDPAERGVA